MTTKDILESMIQRLSRLEAKLDLLTGIIPELEHQRAAIQSIRSEMESNYRGFEGWAKEIVRAQS